MATIETIRNRLERSRRELLDLSTRNRLISTVRGSSRTRSIEIVDELSDEVFRRLVQDRKPMSFLAGKEAHLSEHDGRNDERTDLGQPEADDESSGEVSERHVDAFLQTSLSSIALQKRLLNIFIDASTFEEEQGVNILYLALGFLQWFEAPQSDRIRYAPLLLLPVELERQSVGTRFKLRFRDEEITTNLSLQAKLQGEFNIQLPSLPEVEDLLPSTYLAAVSEAVRNQDRWKVLPNDMVLWFFSFSKFLMYRDLQPENWPPDKPLEDHALITGLLEEGFRSDPPICGDDDKIDSLISAADMVHVLDADSSQAVAIEEIRRGRNMVIQGPPGTGKSQTIANLISIAVRENKSVLFVAEKMAALNVVKSRLDKVGLGEMCLELHSQKANKRAVVEDLARTLVLGRPNLGASDGIIESLSNLRDQLNGHVELLHKPLGAAGFTPFQIIGNLVRLRARGVPPADFELRGAQSWSRTQLQEYENLLADLVIHLKGIGTPALHPWRGVKAKAFLPMDIDRLKVRLRELIDQLDRLIEGTRSLSKELHASTGETAMDSSTIARLGQRLAIAPEMDRPSMADIVWQTRRSDIGHVIKSGLRLEQSRNKLIGVVAEVAWSADVTSCRRDLAAHGRSWLRWFNKDYHAAQATLRGILKDEPPTALSERLSILDQLIEGQAALRDISVKEGDDELGQRAFGSCWRAQHSDWKQLSAVDSWEAECRQAKLPSTFRQVMARMEDLSHTKRLVRQIATELKPALQEANRILLDLQVDMRIAFGNTSLYAVPLEDLRTRCQSWLDNTELLAQWMLFQTRLEKLESVGITELCDRLFHGKVEPDAAIDRFRIAYFEALMRRVVSGWPVFANFDGMSHERLIASFRQCDVSRIDLARHEVALAHFERLPLDRSGIGELGIIQREIEKKRRHLPLRQLLKKAGNAIQAIKPVFMMSPISVAQFLEPGQMSFDLLLIDEASQVTPVDALGAIARVRQVVVVGDDKQLPPTRFFDKMLADDGDDVEEDDAFSAGDIESILGLCHAQGMPQRMLRWHYRSRHDSLIAVSNKEFYGNRLHVAPSAETNSGNLGLRFHQFSNGVFDRGGSRANQIEAAEVARAVMEHARRFPDRSLGVGAFSVSQRDAILDEVEQLRRNNSSLESYFAPSKPDPFFVKNLENIQGDERDVIFISVGYGRDKDGYMAMSFGPVQSDGGERRLNVLFTRARDRCEIFSSITADDIDLTRARSRGAAALKTFLAFAKSGVLDVGVATGHGHDSEFEAEVARELTKLGFDVHAQIGIAGFSIDLAVVDPEVPGRYLIGIECDGATYHSSRSARDRDRLRELVLTNRGWILHRIWSTDWFHRPHEQIQKTLAAIEQAKVHWAGQDGNAARQPRADQAPQRSREIERTAQDNSSRTASPVEAVPYKQVSINVQQGTLSELPNATMFDLVGRILSTEGPIHLDELTRRAVELTGGKRLGKKAAGAVKNALTSLVRSKTVCRERDFYWNSNTVEFPVRNRSDVGSQSLRKPEMLPPVEIRSAIRQVVNASYGVTPDEVITVVARALGFAATSPTLRETIDRQITASIQAGQFLERDNKLFANSS